MEQTYDVVFFKVIQTMQPMDSKVAEVLESMSSLDFVQVGLPATAPARGRVRNAIGALNRIASCRTPAEKLDRLVDAFTELSRSEDEQQGQYDELKNR